ncbi:MAG: hypothetical protein CUN55_15305, partial [Phototrophicales bacterium]
RYRGGEVLPIVTDWAVRGEIERDYTLSVQVVTQEGAVVAQVDSMPIGGFERTSTWEAGASYRDARGIELPQDIRAGEYNIQVIVYYWEDLSRLPVVDETRGIDGDLLILQPITIY